MLPRARRSARIVVGSISDHILAPRSLLSRAVITQQMGGAIKVDWPDAYEKGMSKANFVNLNILGMVDTSCLFPPTNFFSKLVGNTVGPIVLSLLIFLYMFVMRARLYAKGAPAREAKEVTSTCMSSFFALTYLVFPSSSLQVFRAFGCDNVRGCAPRAPRKHRSRTLSRWRDRNSTSTTSMVSKAKLAKLMLTDRHLRDRGTR